MPLTTGNEILYLSYDGMTDPLGRGQVLAYMRGLSAAGYVVSVISFEKPDRFAEFRADIENLCRESGINWYPLMYTKRPPVLSTVYDIQRMWRKTQELFGKKRFKLVHCRSYIAAIAGVKARKKYKIPFVFDMRGFWIDEKMESGEWDEKKYIYRKVIQFLRKKETSFYNEADTIITLTHAAKEVVERERGFGGKTTVIPTCVDLKYFPTFSKQVRSASREKIGIPENAFVLLYSGGYGGNYDINFLLDVYHHLGKVYPRVCLLILSKDGHTGLEGIKDKSGIFTISLPYNEVGNFLMAGDLGVVNYVNKFSVAGRSPTKLGEYWACGLPAIAPAGIGDVDYLFKTYPGSGIIYRKEEFENDLLFLREVNKERLRQYAEQYFSLEHGVRGYRAVYEKLIPNE